LVDVRSSFEERGVEVLISPSYKSGPPGATLSYDITIVNRGNVEDNYALSAIDNEGWILAISPSSVTVLPSENETANLSVSIHENAALNTIDNILVTATSQVDPTISDYQTVEAIVRPDTPYEHVILVVIDGVRPDVLLEANTPNIDTLIAEGSYTWNTWTVTPSITIAAIPSIFTGATPEVHQVTNWDGEIYAETMVEVFEGAGLPCAIMGQDPILGGYSATYCTGYYSHPNADEHFMTLAINMLAENKPYFMTIYNPMPDKRAHAYGHESPEYRESIENADYHIGRLINKLKEFGVFEQTLIVITTDHGMTGTSHSYGYETDMRIFSIWRGPGIKRGFEMFNMVYVHGTETYDNAYVAHRTIDIAPTITELVGVRAPENAEGEVIWQIFEEVKLVISITPSYQSGLPNTTLNFTIKVANADNVEDTYDLIAADNLGWNLNIFPSSLTVPPRENRFATLSVTIPSSAEGCTEDDVLVTAVSRSDNAIRFSDTCVAHATQIIRGVDVLISPDYQGGLRGTTLHYTVSIFNVGNIEDTYDLTVEDNEGWGPVLDNYSLTVPSSENRTTILRITIPENAEICTVDNIRVTAVSRENAEIGGSASCLAHAVIRAVEVSIFPDYREGAPGTFLTYLVTIFNKGSFDDNYALSATDNIALSWDLEVSPTSIFIPAGETGSARLRAYIPENAALSTINRIYVTATSMENAEVSDNASCMAHVKIPEPHIIVRGDDSAFNSNQSGSPPWKEYTAGDRPPIMVAQRVGSGAVVASGTVATCRDGRWNPAGTATAKFDVLLDKAFQWMVLGAEKVLWYEGYNVYNNTSRCSQLIAALRAKGYDVIGASTTPITGELLAPYDILVIPQLQLGLRWTGGDPSLLPDADVEAIKNFVEGGKGLLIMDGSDWAGYNYYKVQNKILEALGFDYRFQSDQVSDDDFPAPYWFDAEVGENDFGVDYQTATGLTKVRVYSVCSLATGGPPAEIIPPHSDYGLDTDNDGLYNYLVIEVRLEVRTSDRYHISGDVFDLGTGAWIESEWAENYLDEGVQFIKLYFDGPRIRSSGEDGPYWVSLWLYDSRWDWIDHGAHITSAYSHLDFQPPPAVLMPPHSDYGLDTDNDGLYNYLVIDVKAEVRTAGFYRISGSLRDSIGNYITHEWSEAYLTEGIQTIQLRFKGREINTSGRNGPYQVYLWLYDYEWNWLDSGKHWTAAYTYTQFQPPPAMFEPPHWDYGLDTDHDGFYNYLIVEVRVKVNKAGQYRVSGSLYDNGWDYITFASSENYLNAGVQIVYLRFDGRQIRRSGKNGPYKVYLRLYENRWDWLDSDTYTTGWYSYWGFQAWPAELAPPHSDQGLDTDNDGFYNYLVVDVRVWVETPGFYRISGTLYDYMGYYITSAQSDGYLGRGHQTIQIRFWGPSIWRAQRDGPYQVSLRLWDKEWTWLDSGWHMTSGYSYTQFQAWPAELAPPHSDYGLDTDNDGFYNYLVVDVNLKIRTAGWYRLSGELYHSYWHYITSAEIQTYLDAGARTVQLRFKAGAIKRSKKDDDYRVYLELYDNEGNRLGYDLHRTSPYYWIQFRPSLVWQVGPADVNEVGWYASTTLDSNGNGYLSYYDIRNGDLKYAQWTGSGWAIEVVDNAGDVGGWTSIALDSSGRPHISYYDFTNRCLKYARWTDSSWVIQTVDPAWEVGKFSSLALDSNDYPHIAYWDERNNHLKYARWTGARWEIERVDTIGDVGKFCSLALDGNDRAHISYYGNWHLKYARRTSTGWVKESVARADVSYGTSIALDRQDRPHIAYFDLRYADLVYARLTDEGWNVETVDSQGNVGWQPSIAIDSGGLIHISYFDLSGEKLKYAIWTGLGWSIQTIAPAQVSYACPTSMALDDGDAPHISFLGYDGRNYILMFADGEYAP
jgi:uncharacterized membrane protein